ncbi:hypothetical protein vseg_014657 [Gypsophila vaccaria]
MGKPSRWFNKLLGRCRRKTVPNNTTTTSSSPDEGNDDGGGGVVGGNGVFDDSNKHAIAVAAATAAVAEAALAAAKAAAEVVRLTSSGSNNNVGRVSRRRVGLDELAAVKIQSAFRGYLARRALKALKGLVKLQALVRGYFVRKQSADMLQRLQAMVRVQARARSNRVLNIESSHCSPGKASSSRPDIRGISEDSEHSSVLKRSGSNSSLRDTATSWLDSWVTDEKNAKILEIVDSYRPESNARTRNTNKLDPSRQISTHDCHNRSFASTAHQNPISEDTASLKSLHFPHEKRAFSGSPRTGSMRIVSPKTPSKDECTRSYLNGYATFSSPSYMSNTQSSRAKSRSHSVPRHREIEPEKLGSIKRSLHALWDSKTSSKRSLDSFANLSKQRW